MIHWKVGKVIEIKMVRKDYQEIRVMTQPGTIFPAIHYLDTLPPVATGDEVLLNTTAVDLQLGTGGYHFVYAAFGKNQQNYINTCLVDVENNTYSGHMMKLRYTPLQKAYLSIEEPDSTYHSLFQGNLHLEGMPVLIGELHSMLPIAVHCLRWLERSKRPIHIVYIMSDGGALPLSFSHHVHSLMALDLLDGTISYGQAYGGELESVNKFTALLAARHVNHADIAIMIMGPGNAGTGTKYGFSGIETGEMINAVHMLGGKPIMIPRISFLDKRERHHGLSHHTITSLTRVSLAPATLPLPQNISTEKKQFIEHQVAKNEMDYMHNIQWTMGFSLEQLRDCLRDYPLDITSMGRGLEEDPDFFFGVSVAAHSAWGELDAMKQS